MNKLFCFTQKKKKKYTLVTNKNCLNFEIFQVREIFLCEKQSFLSENFIYKISRACVHAHFILLHCGF